MSKGLNNETTVGALHTAAIVNTNVQHFAVYQMHSFCVLVNCCAVFRRDIPAHVYKITSNTEKRQKMPTMRDQIFSSLFPYHLERKRDGRCLMSTRRFFFPGLQLQTPNRLWDIYHICTCTILLCHEVFCFVNILIVLPSNKGLCTCEINVFKTCQ